MSFTAGTGGVARWRGDSGWPNREDARHAPGLLTIASRCLAALRRTTGIGRLTATRASLFDRSRLVRQVFNPSSIKPDAPDWRSKRRDDDRHIVKLAARAGVAGLMDDEVVPDAFLESSARRGPLEPRQAVW